MWDEALALELDHFELQLTPKIPFQFLHWWRAWSSFKLTQGEESHLLVATQWPFRDEGELSSRHPAPTNSASKGTCVLFWKLSAFLKIREDSWNSQEQLKSQGIYCMGTEFSVSIYLEITMPSTTFKLIYSSCTGPGPGRRLNNRNLDEKAQLNTLILLCITIRSV
jgi:hypothetical protein